MIVTILYWFYRSEGNGLDRWQPHRAASLEVAIAAVRAGETVEISDRGGNDFHFWAACAVMKRSIIGVCDLMRLVVM